VKAIVRDRVRLSRYPRTQGGEGHTWRPGTTNGDVVDEWPVGYERSKVSVDRGPVEPATRRVTHVYRREDGEWKIVHRHRDHPPIDQSPPSSDAPAFQQ